MRFVNEYDIQHARQRMIRANVPNRLALVLVVENLAEETSWVSDGWAYWRKPQQAAQRAIALFESTTWAANAEQEREDISDADMAAAVRPIRSFLTRHKAIYGPERIERILRAVDAPTSV